MKNILSSLTESEKRRILEMHYRASGKQYLTENPTGTTPTQKTTTTPARTGKFKEVENLKGMLPYNSDTASTLYDFDTGTILITTSHPVNPYMSKTFKVKGQCVCGATGGPDMKWEILVNNDEHGQPVTFSGDRFNTRALTLHYKNLCKEYIINHLPDCSPVSFEESNPSVQKGGASEEDLDAMYRDLLKIPSRTRTDDSIKAAEKRMASYETSYADDPETKEKMIEVEKSTIEGLNNKYDTELSYLSSTFSVGYKKDKICGFINTKQYDNANFMKYKTTVTEVLRLPMIYPDPKPTSQELSSLSLVQLGEKYCGTGGSQTPTPAGPPAPKQ